MVSLHQEASCCRWTPCIRLRCVCHRWTPWLSSSSSHQLVGAMKPTSLLSDYAGRDRAYCIGSWPRYFQGPPSVARWDLLLTLYILVNYSFILPDDRFDCLVGPFIVPAAVHLLHTCTFWCNSVNLVTAAVAILHHFCRHTCSVHLNSCKIEADNAMLLFKINPLDLTVDNAAAVTKVQYAC